MLNNNMLCSMVTDNGIYTESINKRCQSVEINNANLEISYCCGLSIFDISIINKNTNPINIKKLCIKLITIDLPGYINYAVNPENPENHISLKLPSNLKINEKDISYLYSFFIGKEDYQSIFYGFLSSHGSKNYFEIERDKNTLCIYAVYDFINETIAPKAALKLDEIYFESGRNHFELLNNYANMVSDKFCSSKQCTDLITYPQENKNVFEDNILFTASPCEESIKVNNKPIQINCHGHKLYPIDLTLECAHRNIINRYDKIQNNNYNIIHVKNIAPYINTVSALKRFNVYANISSLLMEIKQNFKNTGFAFSDCPVGIAIGNIDTIKRTINIQKSTNIVSKLLSHKDDENIHHDFIIKTIVEKNILNNNTAFLTQNKKLQNALEIITKSIPCSTLSEYREIFNDIDDMRPIVAHINKDNTFEILRYGKKAIYIAIFNLSNSNKRIYWDFSLLTKLPVNNGVAVDIFSENNYMIINGKIDIRRLPSNDCCLIKKPYSNMA